MNKIGLVTPFPAYAWPRVWGWLNAVRSRVADDWAPSTIEEFVDQQVAHEADGRISFGVMRGSELGGLIVCQRAHAQAISADVHFLFKKSFFGRSHTTPALTQAFDLLFDGGLLTLRGEVFYDNSSIRAVMRDLGAQEYGIPPSPERIRKAERHGKRPPTVSAIPNITLRDGEPIGVIGLVLTREDFEDARRRNDSSDLGRRVDRVGAPVESEAKDDDVGQPDAGAEANSGVVGEPAGDGSDTEEPDRPTPGPPAADQRGEDERQPGD